MNFTYRTRGTCSTQINFDLTDNIVRNVSFTNGCNGNLQALSSLVDGMTVEQIAERLSGINCGGRGTSCADQLCRALSLAAAQLQQAN